MPTVPSWSASGEETEDRSVLFAERRERGDGDQHVRSLVMLNFFVLSILFLFVSCFRGTAVLLQPSWRPGSTGRNGAHAISSNPTHKKSYVIEMTAYMCTISAFVRAYLLRYMIHRVLLLIALFSLSSVVMSRQHLFLSSTRHNQWCFSCTAAPPVALRLYC